jgi:Ribonuclease G/E
MNAYELADELEWHWDNDCRSPAISKSADMLRKQADRIAELEKKLSQPMQILNDGRIVPVFKELSDEEIREIFEKNWLDLKDYKEFARLILKKASEK